jgi:RNA-directed DNA polymerase
VVHKRQPRQLELSSQKTSRGESHGRQVRGERNAAGSGRKRQTTFARLMEEICRPANLKRALERVKSNKGSPGVDGMTVKELPGFVWKHWGSLRTDLLRGKYKPRPIKRQLIPKPGGGMRKLGIPCAVDRFVQQAILQVLHVQWEPVFSE